MNPSILKRLKAAGIELPLRRELTVEPRILNAGEGTVEYVASDETMDCYREIIRVSGWRFTKFAKNAPFVNSHDYSDIRNLLGEVVSWRMEKTQLVQVVRYNLDPEGLGWKAFKMVRDKFLKAVSVGFEPLRMVSKWDNDLKDFQAQVAELKLDAQAAAALRAVFIEQEQIELSQCIIGANPNALAKSYGTIARAWKAGCLSDQDLEQLSAMIADVKPATPAAPRADAGVARRRARLAILMEITNQK